MRNMNRTFTFGTLKALHNFISTVQEENACLITLPVNKYNLFCDFCFFFCQVSVGCLYSLITSAFRSHVSFSSNQSATASFARRNKGGILDIDASVFVLPSSFCSDAELSGTEGIQTLSASITLPLPLACSLFSSIMQEPIIFAAKRGISVHFEICIREACIITACTSLNILSEKVDCVHVG